MSGVTPETLRAQIAAVRALHRRVDEGFLFGDCAAETCDHEDECPTKPVGICVACWSIAEEVDHYFAERRCPDQVLWPCPTARALGVDR